MNAPGSRAAEWRWGPTHRWALLGVIAAYLLCEAAYLTHMPLIMDEFQGASAAYALAGSLPYRDFIPYKTVLGYYLQLPVLLIVREPWAGLIALKAATALLNAAVLVLASFRLSRHFRPIAVLLGLVLLVVMTSFLERSAELRVDMLTAWLGLASLLLLLERRWAGGGVMAGLSFLISQKGIYFIGAGALALGWVALRHAPVPQRRSGALRRYTAGVAVPIAVYFIFWMIVASPEAVFDATFRRAAAIAVTPLPGLRFYYWAQTILQNLGFWLFAVLGLGVLIRRDPRPRDAVAVLAPYAAVIALVGATCRQPWPYFFVLLAPTAFVVIVALFDRTITAIQQRGWRPLHVAMAATYLTAGVALPAAAVPINLQRDSGYQAATIRLAHAILAPTDRYVAGVDLLRDRSQALRSLQWLDFSRQQAIAHLDSRSAAALADSLALARPKAVIWNYRLRYTPAAVRYFLDNNYAHLWAGVWVYAPTIRAGTQQLTVWYSGEYAVLPTPFGERAEVTIDGQPVTTPDSIHLGPGLHRVTARSAGRLIFQPGGWRRFADPRWRDPDELFPGSYQYGIVELAAWAWPRR